MWVYDFGAHNGDDTEYYLLKGLSVVAVEANTALCDAITERFSTYIKSGQLQVLNKAVGPTEGEATFYIHKKESEWSTLVPPADLTEWNKVDVQTAPLVSMINPSHDVTFIKIDVEGVDYEALDSIEKSGRSFADISCEAHHIKILSKLICMGYKKFRLVNCKTMRKQKLSQRIACVSGTPVKYRFSRNSSGPFGEDLHVPWLTAEQAVCMWTNRLTLLGTGWYDIHARLD